MATSKKSILDSIEEKGKANLLVNFSESAKIAGDHQSDEQKAQVSVLATADKFRTVGIKALVSW